MSCRAVFQFSAIPAGVVFLLAANASALSTQQIWKKKFSGGVENAELSYDGKLIAVGYKSGSTGLINVVDADNPDKVVKKFTLVESCDTKKDSKCSEVESIAWSEDGKYLAAGGNKSAIKVWEYETGKLIYSGSKGEHDGMRAAGSVFFMANGGSLEVYDAANRQKGSASGSLGCGINSVDFSADRKTMVVGSCGGAEYAGGYISIWSVNGASATMTKKVKTLGSVKTTRITADGKYLLTAEGGCGQVRIRDRNLDVVKSIKTPGSADSRFKGQGSYAKGDCPEGGSYVDHAEFSPDGKILVTQAKASSAYFHSVPDGKEVHKASSVGNGEYMSWRKDKLLVASSGGDLVLFRVSGVGAAPTALTKRMPPASMVSGAERGQAFNLLGMRLPGTGESRRNAMGVTLYREGEAGGTLNPRGLQAE